MNKIKIEFSGEWGSTIVIKDLDGCHISYYVDAFVRALLAEGFQQGSINRYIPDFDIGSENDPSAAKYFEQGN